MQKAHYGWSPEKVHSYYWYCSCKHLVLPSLWRFSTASDTFIRVKFSSVVTLSNTLLIFRSFPRPISSNFLSIQPSHSFSHMNHIKCNRFITRRRIYYCLENCRKVPAVMRKLEGVKQLQKQLYKLNVSVHYLLLTLYHVRGCCFGGSEVGAQILLFKLYDLCILKCSPCNPI